MKLEAFCQEPNGGAQNCNDASISTSKLLFSIRPVNTIRCLFWRGRETPPPARERGALLSMPVRLLCRLTGTSYGRLSVAPFPSALLPGEESKTRASLVPNASGMYTACLSYLLKLFVKFILTSLGHFQGSLFLFWNELGNSAYGFHKFQDVAVIIASFENTVSLFTNHEYMQLRRNKRISTNSKDVISVAFFQRLVFIWRDLDRYLLPRQAFYFNQTFCSVWMRSG